MRAEDFAAMRTSDDEKAVRADAVAWLRRQAPTARVVHELVCRQGGERADLAAIGPRRLVMVEIKSRKDTLARLADQVAAMRRVADQVAVFAHVRHFGQGPDGNRLVHKGEPMDLPGDVALYRWHEPERYDRAYTRPAKPRAYNLAARLEMLWADELRRLAGAYGGGIAATSPRRECQIALLERAPDRPCVGASALAVLATRAFPYGDAPRSLTDNWTPSPNAPVLTMDDTPQPRPTT